VFEHLAKIDAAIEEAGVNVFFNGWFYVQADSILAVPMGTMVLDMVPAVIVKNKPARMKLERVHRVAHDGNVIMSCIDEYEVYVVRQKLGPTVNVDV
jgi:hypothetical protein